MWAALINTEPAKNLSDLVLTLVPVLLFIPGFLFGLFNYGRLAGVILITVASGFSWGVRICLFRSDLLVREVYGDWLIGTAFAFLNVCLVPYFERIAVVRSLRFWLLVSPGQYADGNTGHCFCIRWDILHWSGYRPHCEQASRNEPRAPSLVRPE